MTPEDSLHARNRSPNLSNLGNPTVCGTSLPMKSCIPCSLTDSKGETVTISASTTEQLLVEQFDQVLLITLNRPERLNAISRDMLDELSAKVVAADKDSEIRCMVLTGEGKGFCAGLDFVDTNKRREDEEEGTDSIHNRPPVSFLICATLRSTLCGIATRPLSAQSTVQRRATVWI